MLFTIFRFLRDHPKPLIGLALLIIFLLLVPRPQSVNEKLEAINRQQVAEITAAHLREKQELQAAAQHLKDELLRNQQQYQQSLLQLQADRRKVTQAIIDKSGGNPHVIAQELATEYGFTVWHN